MSRGKYIKENKREEEKKKVSPSLPTVGSAASKLADSWNALPKSEPVKVSPSDFAKGNNASSSLLNAPRLGRLLQPSFYNKSGEPTAQDDLDYLRKSGRVATSDTLLNLFNQPETIGNPSKLFGLAQTARTEAANAQLMDRWQPQMAKGPTGRPLDDVLLDRFAEDKAKGKPLNAASAALNDVLTTRKYTRDWTGSLASNPNYGKEKQVGNAMSRAYINNMTEEEYFKRISDPVVRSQLDRTLAKAKETREDAQTVMDRNIQERDSELETQWKDYAAENNISDEDPNYQYLRSNYLFNVKEGSKKAFTDDTSAYMDAKKRLEETPAPEEWPLLSWEEWLEKDPTATGIKQKGDGDDDWQLRRAYNAYKKEVKDANADYEKQKESYERDQRIVDEYEKKYNYNPAAQQQSATAARAANWTGNTAAAAEAIMQLSDAGQELAATRVWNQIWTGLNERLDNLSALKAEAMMYGLDTLDIDDEIAIMENDRALLAYTAEAWEPDFKARSVVNPEITDATYRYIMGLSERSGAGSAKPIGGIDLAVMAGGMPMRGDTAGMKDLTRLRDYMGDEQKALYAYLYNVDPEQAKDYLDKIENKAIYDQYVKKQEEVNDYVRSGFGNGLWANVEATANFFNRTGEAVTGMLESLFGVKTNPYDSNRNESTFYTQNVRGATKAAIDADVGNSIKSWVDNRPGKKFLGFTGDEWKSAAAGTVNTLYDAGTQGAESTISATIGAGAGLMLGGVMGGVAGMKAGQAIGISLQSAQGGYQRTLREKQIGHSDPVSFIMGCTDAAINQATEMVGMEWFTNAMLGDVKSGKSFVKSLLGGMGRSMLSEGGEEIVGAPVVLTVDNIVNGADSEVNRRASEIYEEHKGKWSRERCETMAYLEWAKGTGMEAVTAALSAGGSSIITGAGVYAGAIADTHSTIRNIEQNLGVKLTPADRQTIEAGVMERAKANLKMDIEPNQDVIKAAEQVIQRVADGEMAKTLTADAEAYYDSLGLADTQQRVEELTGETEETGPSAAAAASPQQAGANENRPAQEPQALDVEARQKADAAMAALEENERKLAEAKQRAREARERAREAETNPNGTPEMVQLAESQAAAAEHEAQQLTQEHKALVAEAKRTEQEALKAAKEQAKQQRESEAQTSPSAAAAASPQQAGANGNQTEATAGARSDSSARKQGGVMSKQDYVEYVLHKNGLREVSPERAEQLEEMVARSEELMNHRSFGAKATVGGAAVTVENLTKAGGKANAMVEITQNGEKKTVPLSEVTFSNPQIAEAYERASAYQDLQAARRFLGGFETTTMPAASYGRVFSGIYAAARNNQRMTETEAAWAKRLHPRLVRLIQDSGREQFTQDEAAIGMDKSTRESFDRSLRTVPTAQNAPRGYKGLTLDFDTQKAGRLTDHKRVELEILDRLAKKRGLQITVTDQVMETASGNRINGSYSPSTNQILINLDAMEGGLVGATFHEAWHAVCKAARGNAALLAQVEDFEAQIVSYLERDENFDMDDRIAEILDAYKAAGKELTDDAEGTKEEKAKEEIIANSLMGIADSGVQQELADIARDHQTVIEKIADFLKNMIRDITETIKRVTGHSTEARTLRAQTEGRHVEVGGQLMDAANFLNHYYEALTTAAMQVRENQNQENQAENENNAQESAEDARSDGTRFSIQHMEDGTPYVLIDTEQDIFDGVDEKNYPAIARKYIMDHYRNTPIVEGSVLRATRSSAKEYTSRHGQITDTAFYSKQKAVTEVGNLVRIAEILAPAKDNGSHSSATGGWDYGLTRFKVGNNTFSGIINIMNTPEGPVFYDITNVEDITAPKQPSEGSISGNVLKENIPQNDENSNGENGKERLSLDVSAEQQELLEEYRQAQKDMNELRTKYHTMRDSAEYQEWLERIGKAGKGANMDALLAEYKAWDDETGFSATKLALDEAEKRFNKANTAFNEYLENRNVEEERQQIEKSGLDEGEWRRKQAVKEFGLTTNFAEAGYLMPNGKMLNFSGEKGRHYGHRGQDHRAIGTVFASDQMQGSAAMLAFMHQGNIRVMAESPGIDISTANQPTSEQYNMIRQMASRFAREEYFNVDLTDERGDVIGSLEYEGRINPTRIVNDIKTYFRTGEVVDTSSSLDQFRYSLDTPAERMAFDEETLEGAEDFRLSMEEPDAAWEAKVFALEADNKRFRELTAQLAAELNEWEERSGKLMTHKNLETLARNLKKQTHATNSIKSITHDLSWAYELLTTADSPAKAQTAIEALGTVARSIVESGQILQTDVKLEGMQDEIREARGSIRRMSLGTKKQQRWNEVKRRWEWVPMSRIYKEEFAGDLQSWRANYAGRVATGRGEVCDIETVYSELCYTCPSFFQDMDGKTMSEMWEDMMRFMDATEPKRVNPNALNERYQESQDALNASTNGVLIQLLQAYAGSGEAKDTSPVSSRRARAVNDLVQKVDDLFRTAQQDERVPHMDGMSRGEYEKQLDQMREKMRAWQQEQRAKNRERVDQAVQRTREHMQEVQQRRDERREATEAKNKLRGEITRKQASLTKKLNNPNSQGYVPIKMQQAVTHLLEALQFDETAEDGANVLSREALLAAKDAYMSINKEGAGEEARGPMAAYYNGDLESSFDRLLETAVGKRARDLDQTELENLRDIVAGFAAAVINEDRVFSDARKESLREMGGAMIRESQERARTYGEKKTQGALQEFMLNGLSQGLLKPVTVFERFKGTELGEIYEKALRPAEWKHIRNVQQAGDYLDSMLDKYNQHESVDKDSPRYRKERSRSFTLTSGRTISLTDQELMTLYAWQKREQRMKTNHLLGGGIKLANAQRGESMQEYKLSKADLAAFNDALTDEQKGYVDEMVSYLSGQAAEWGNEVTRELYGIEKFTEKYYMPFTVAKNYVASNPAQAQDQRIKTASFTKNLTEKASTVLELKSFTEMWCAHVEQMSDFNAFTLPMEDMVRLMNYKEGIYDEEGNFVGTGETLRPLMQRAWGNQTVSYIHDFLTRLNGNSRSEHGGNWLNTLMGKAKGSAVTFNLSVAFQQAGAGVRAMAEMNPADVMKGLAQGAAGFRKNFRELQQWAPIAVEKDWGYFDTNMRRGLYDRSKRSSLKVNQMEWLNEKGGALAGMGDEFNWSQIWSACKAETRRLHPELTGDAFYQRAADRFTEVIDKTQVVDSIFQRSQWATEKGMMRNLMSFMSEPVTMYNMFYRGVVNIADAVKSGDKEANKKAWAALVKTSVSILCSAALTAALKSAVTGLRDRDNEKKDEEGNITGVRTYWDKARDSWASNMWDNLLGVGSIYVKMYQDATSGFGSSDLTTSWLTNLSRGIKELGKGAEADFEKAGYYIAQGISSLTGVGFGGLWRDTKAIYKTAEEILNAESLAGTAWDQSKPLETRLAAAVKNYAYSAEYKKAHPGTKTNSGFYSDMLVAEYMKNGFSEDYKKIADAAISVGATSQGLESSFKTKLRKAEERIPAAAKALNDGDLETYNRLMQELSEAGIGSKALNSMVKSEYNALQPKEEEDPGTGGDLVEQLQLSDKKTTSLATSVATGYLTPDSTKDDVVKAVRLMKQDGLDKDAIGKKLSAEYKKAYAAAVFDGNTTEAKRLLDLMTVEGSGLTRKEIMEWPTEMAYSGDLGIYTMIINGDSAGAKKRLQWLYRSTSNQKDVNKKIEAWVKSSAKKRQDYNETTVRKVLRDMGYSQATIESLINPPKKKK